MRAGHKRNHQSRLVGMLLCLSFMFAFQNEAQAAEPSVVLPSGFVPDTSNEPPDHEFFVKDINRFGHQVIFSADRHRFSEQLFKKMTQLVKKHGERVIAPAVAGVLSADIQNIKDYIGEPKGSMQVVAHETEPYVGDLPSNLCEGFSWKAQYANPNDQPEEVVYTAYGVTVECIFLSDDMMWSTTASIIENVFRAHGDSLSEDFENTASKILATLSY